MELKRFADRDNFRDIEAGWKFEFVFYILSNLGIPDYILEGCVPEEGINEFTVGHKIELRKHLKDFDITIVDDRDDGIKIYVKIEQDNQIEHVMVAEWKKCKFYYREDPIAIDPTKRIYIEIIADTWAIFEEEDYEDDTE